MPPAAIYFIGLDEFGVKLARTAGEAPERIDKGLLQFGELVRSKAQENVTGGGSSKTMLNVRSGLLRSAIHAALIRSGTVAIGIPGGTVPYGRIHEYGGTIHHPGGTAYFWSERLGRMVFLSNKAAAGHDFPRTQPHDIPIPARPYLRPALESEKVQGTAIVRLAYMAVLNGAA